MPSLHPGGGSCQTTDYPPTPAGAAGTVHVSAGCPSDAADGSAANPYPTIQQGVDHAQSGDAVLVAAGTYAENVTIAKPVAVVGAPAESDFAAAPVVLRAPAPYAITIAADTQEVQLYGLAVVNPIGVGVWVQSSAEATLKAVRVEGAVAGVTQYGYGVLVEGYAELSGCGFEGSERAGVLVSGGTGIIAFSQIDRNRGRGGVRVESSSAEVNIHDNGLDGNERVGIAVYGSSAVLKDNVITNTSPGPLGFGDGVAVGPLLGQAGISTASLTGNAIEGSGRVGVLFSGGATGAITGNMITGNGVGSPFFAAGIWAQAGAGGPSGLSITGNTISGNRYVGLGLTGSARATIKQNTVSDTMAAMVLVGFIGDGIGVFKGAQAAITGNNMIQDNGRFGLILDAADASSTVTDDTIRGSVQFGVVAQDQAAPDLSTDTLTGNMGGPSTVVAEGTFSVVTDDFELP